MLRQDCPKTFCDIRQGSQLLQCLLKAFKFQRISGIVLKMFDSECVG